jgi:long-chain fatty acid transport protein
MRTTSKATLLGSTLACAATVVAPSARAGGIALYEIATPDVGLASAGYAARAEDASTLFKNPAGMSRLHEPQLQTGLQLLYGDVQFTPDANTSRRLGTDDGGNALGALPAASLFYVHELSEKVSVGLGTLSYFGLMEDYNANWVGRYYVQESALVGVTLMPSVSFKATDWLSIGAGLNAMYGFLNTEVAVNNLEPLLGDGQLAVKDHAWGFGANAGILIEPRPGTRIGATYLSRVKLDFADTPTFSNLGPGLGALLANPSRLDLGMTVPQSVMLSFYHELSERLALMADVGWQNWEQFGYVQVGVASATSRDLTANLQYQNTWHGAAGVQYAASQTVKLTGGVAYDSSAVDDANRSVVLPMGKNLRVGAGLLWQVGKKVSLGGAAEFLWAGDMSVDQGEETSLRGRVSGSYNDAFMLFFTGNLTWKF